MLSARRERADTADDPVSGALRGGNSPTRVSIGAGRREAGQCLFQLRGLEISGGRATWLPQLATDRVGLTFNAFPVSGVL